MNSFQTRMTSPPSMTMTPTETASIIVLATSMSFSSANERLLQTERVRHEGVESIDETVMLARGQYDQESDAELPALDADADGDHQVTSSLRGSAERLQRRDPASQDRRPRKPNRRREL